MLYYYKIKVWHENFGEYYYIVEAKNAKEALVNAYEILEEEKPRPDEWILVKVRRLNLVE